MVTKGCRIATNYATGWFIPDLLGSVPTDLIVLIAGTDVTAQSQLTFQLLAILRIARLFRLSRLFALAAKLKATLYIRLGLLLSGLVLITHYVACLFGVLPKLEGWLGYVDNFSGEADAPSNWLEAGGVADLSPGVQYTYALYWAAASLTSVGYGDVTGVSMGELLYSVVVMLFGAVVTANIFALFTSLIARLNTQEMQYQMRQEKWNIYMRDR